MRYAINWTDVLLSSEANGDLERLVNGSWPLEKCDDWEYDTSLVQSSIVIDVSKQNGWHHVYGVPCLPCMYRFVV